MGSKEERKGKNKEGNGGKEKMEQNEKIERKEYE